MEFRRFLHEIVLLPAQVLRTGRQLVFRLLAVNRWVPLLLDGTHQLKHQALRLRAVTSARASRRLRERCL